MSGQQPNSTFILLTDTLVCGLASLSSILLYRAVGEPVHEFVSIVLHYIVYSLACSLLAVYFSKTYRVIFTAASFDAVKYPLFCSLIKVALLFCFFFISQLSMSDMAAILIFEFTLSTLGLILIKLVAQFYSQPERGNNEQELAVNCLNILIYGTSDKALAAAIRYFGSNKYHVLGFLTRNKSMSGKIIRDLPVLYLPDNIETSHFKDAEAIMFVRQEDWEAENNKLIDNCLKRGICILSLPTVQMENYQGADIKEIKHALESEFIPDKMSTFGKGFKRMNDIIISGIAIAIFSPAMAIISIILLLTDGKPVIFRQERIGRFGKPFMILKFRTMRNDAESAGPALYSGDDDPRMTKAGRFLRLHHLDEMPQLFNIFKGDMSLVGYRPERKVYIDQIMEKDARYKYLYQIRPGVTSYSTLKNGYADSLDKMLRRLKFDLYYLNHRSFFFDLKILWETFLNIVIGKKF